MYVCVWAQNVVKHSKRTATGRIQLCWNVLWCTRKRLAPRWFPPEKSLLLAFTGFSRLVRNDILLAKGSCAVYATRVRPLENNVRIQTLLGKLIPFRILYYHTYVLESITSTIVLSGGVRSPQETVCIIANSYFPTVFDVAVVCAMSVIM